MEKQLKTVIVLGSGGHTTEMIKLLGGTNLTKFQPRDYIVADNDSMSIQKVNTFEETNHTNNTYSFHRIKRSRNVGQSYFTSIFTTLISILASLPLIIKLEPNILIVNGPGTCIPCCLCAFILSKLRIIPSNLKIVFVESFCRVETLSLTGKILYYLNITHAFFVQWPELYNKYPKSIYIGRLV
jgi:beta-1,4-N-acetylglucosaminyltransferase